MEKVEDFNKLNMYILNYNVNSFFTHDMSQYMELMLFKKGEHICKEGEKIEYFFFLVKGKAKVYRLLKNGKALLMSFNCPFEVIGDVEFINKNIADSNVEAIEDSYCIAIPFKYVREFALEDPKFLKYMCNELAYKLSRSTSNNSINLLYPLESRLASYILAFITSNDDNNDKFKNRHSKYKVEFEGNLIQIAELLGSSYRHLLRVMKNFCDKQVLKKHKGYYEVLNKEVLITIAGEVYQ